MSTAVESASGFDLFLSHASADKEWVRRLKAELENEGLRSFLDERELQPGGNWVLDLSEGLLQSRFLVLVLTRESIGRPWVTQEWTMFLAKHGPHGRVFPVLLESVELPTILGPVQSLDARDRDPARVARELARLIGRPGELPADLKELDEQIERLLQDVEEAATNQDFELAAALRDQADRLKKKRAVIGREWRERSRKVNDDSDMNNAVFNGAAFGGSQRPYAVTDNVDRFSNHPIVKSYRFLLDQLAADLSGLMTSQDLPGTATARKQRDLLEGQLHQLYRMLEEDPGFGLSAQDAIGKYCREVPWFEGRCVRREQLTGILQGLRVGRRVILVGPPGSGRKTLARALAREVFRESAQNSSMPVRLLALNHFALGEGEGYAQSLSELLAELGARESQWLALEDLHHCVDITRSSPEVVDAWRIGMADCLGRQLRFLAWTTPAGCDRLRSVWPGMVQNALIVPLSPLSEEDRGEVARERMEELTKTRQVSFAEGFLPMLLASRERWRNGPDFAEPGRTLDLLEQVTEHAHSGGAGEVLNIGGAKLSQDAPGMPRVERAIGLTQIEAFLGSSQR
jgi:hypothetical protein